MRRDREAHQLLLLVSSWTMMLAPRALAAQDARAAGAEGPRPVAVAVRITRPIRVDGVLDDSAWAAATPITTFTQQEPDEGASPSQRTEVRFVYDADALYVGARMYEARGASAVTSRLARHDDDPESDLLSVEFDTFLDRLHHVGFDVNPAGWRGDTADEDPSWDPVWEAASRVDSLGWTTEMRIPFSQLRFSRDSVQTWGLEVTRLTHRTQEHDLWAFWRQNERGGPAFFGTLTGLRIHALPERAEVLPYVVTRAKRLGSGDPRSPFRHPNAEDVRAGADLKYLLTSNFTVNATVNPDFGQVEVDPAVVNLTAFETFFQEKRPFFVEGSDRFAFGQPGCNINCGLGLDLFYSRRIGRPPEGAALAYAAGPYADVPENTTILGAAKLTGRTQSGYTVGVLDAVTRRATADVQRSDGSFGEIPVEPLTNDMVARVTRELRGGNLVLGGIATSSDHDIRDPGIASLLPRSARTGGADVAAYWDQRAWRFYAAVGASDVAGESAAIRRLQESSARYFQRPDRKTTSDGIFGARYDSTTTALAGYGAIARLAKQSGDWIGDLNAASVSPGFETNDLGFMTKADWRWINGTLGRQFTRPTSWYRSLTLMGGTETFWNFDGDVTQRDFTAFANLQTLGYWGAMLIAEHAPRLRSDRLTRGGPVVDQAGGNVIGLNVATDARRRVIFGVNGQLLRMEDGAFNDALSLSAEIRAAPNVNVILMPEYDLSTSTDQYVTSVADPTATRFYGRRYVFAHLDQRQLSMTTRANVTFTPTLSLDLYAQPLIASGAFHAFEEFAAPRQVAKLVYGRDIGTISKTGTGADATYVIDPDGPGPAANFTIGNPDFNYRSLRGTGVLRWEWRPGSTAYLVWTQSRSGVAPVGDLVFRRDEQALFAEPSDNVFVLKISYRLGM